MCGFCGDLWLFLTLAGVRLSPHRWFPRQLVVEVLTAFTVDTVGVVFADTLSMDLDMKTLTDSLVSF